MGLLGSLSLSLSPPPPLDKAGSRIFSHPNARGRPSLQPLYRASAIAPDAVLRLASGEGLHTHATVLRRSPALASRLDRLLTEPTKNVVSLLVVPLAGMTLDEARGALFFLYTGLLPPESSEERADAALPESVCPAHMFAKPLTPDMLAHAAVELQSREMAEAILARYGSSGDAGLPSNVTATVAEGLGRLLSKALPKKRVPLPLLHLQVGMPVSHTSWPGLVWIKVGEERLGADRAVLAARSEYFSAALQASPQQGTPTLVMPPGATLQSVRWLLAFLEADAVDLSTASLDELLELLVLARYTLLYRYVACVSVCVCASGEAALVWRAALLH